MRLPLVPDANHPAFPTRSKGDDWEIKRPVPLDCGEEMAVIGRRCAQAKPSTKTYSARPVASAPTHSTRNIASKSAREQERAARPTRRAGHSERTQGHVVPNKKRTQGRQKKCRKKKQEHQHGETKEIKTGNGDNTKTNPREEPKWKDKARS